MEEGAVTDGVALVCESEAALCDQVIEALDGGEAAVGERFVDELPKVFGRLELGTMGGLEYETNAVGHGEVLGSVPAGISLQTALAMFHTVRPVAGSTKPVT